MNIIEMAQECKLIGMRPHLDGIYQDALEAFAKLVADKAFQSGYEKGIAAFNEAVLIDREAFAKVCEQTIDEIQVTDTISEVVYMDAHECAEAIRARGTT
jgi:hypothetical protein